MRKYRVLASVVLVAGVAGLSACGGGSDSSSGVGASRAGVEYAGTYKGTTSIRVSGFGQTMTQSFGTVLVIDSNGQLGMGLSEASDSGVVCTGEKPIYVNSDGSISASATLTCTVPELGACTIPSKLSGQVTSQAISVKVHQEFNCSVGNFTSDASVKANKQQYARTPVSVDQSLLTIMGVQGASRF